jgi:hypothetical protein
MFAWWDSNPGPAPSYKAIFKFWTNLNPKITIERDRNYLNSIFALFK